MPADPHVSVWPHQLLAFSLTVTVMVVSPGAGFAFVLSTASRLGRTAGAAGVTGMLMGYLTHAVVSLAHQQGRVTLGPNNGLWLRWFGSALLVLLALRALLRAVQPSSHRIRSVVQHPSHGDSAQQRSTEVAPGTEWSAHRLFVSGLLVTTLNPSVLALYIGIAPQHVPDGRPTVAMLVLALVNVTVAASWYGTLLWSLGSYHTFLQRPMARCLIDAITGLMLLWFALQAVQ